MNSNTFLDLVQTSFRVSLGATTSLIESLQDSQKREENLSLLKLDPSQQVAVFAEKGERTEREARIFLEYMLNQQSHAGSPQATQTARENPPASPTSVATLKVQQEIEELTAQIASIRSELEQMRNSGSNH
ncbi:MULTISPECIES: hypothetical protein [unclassified Coleofasciculus]|uniref:hypothetical protein n=1 Tax=unclassified Coleofasciculus TaxID=2692782 RepID=UPI00187E6EFA|nr:MULTISPECIES: hypothetical protein [unclassified Coleofasciculus]MBE9127076.1 hypothetical protein [Coleofasciculus sp. LEGE 07081]MBE9150464.1 hypothetical protein [Coleofasciculus sp. LEGE 07092]